MTLSLHLSGNKNSAIVSAYAPTMTNDDEVKDKFYDDINTIIPAPPRTDKLMGLVTIMLELMSLSPPGSLLATDRSKAVVLV